MGRITAGFYARVSSDGQARGNTVASQVAALRERSSADEAAVSPDHAYVDEGWSGTALTRPALERLRDAIAAGELDRVYVLAPDRLARRYAYQVLLVEEFRRAGVEVVFLNRAIGGSAEDDLLLQVQGMIAEYERARILERSRRGRRHAALSGAVSALCAMPYGYRYLGRCTAGGMARVEVVEEEARLVRQIFDWIGVERISLRHACRRLRDLDCLTRTGLTRWDATTLNGMLRNPAYQGTAMFGRTRATAPAQPRLRPIRGHPQPSRHASSSSMPVAREEWIAIPVPAIVEAGVFEAAQLQLDENRRRKREGRRRPGWLLQGLVVCRLCGYAFYGKMARGTVGDRQPADYGYYRCTGTDAHRYGGEAPCTNRSVRSDKLEQAVWQQVQAVLDDPTRIAGEHERRIAAALGADAGGDVEALDRQIVRLRRGVDRLIDGYTEGIIDPDQFKPRLAGLKGRLTRLQSERDRAMAAHEAERGFQLVLGRIEEFAQRVRAGLDGLDWQARRDVIRTLVRRIEIDRDQVEVVFRVPGATTPSGEGVPPPGSSPAPGPGQFRQHCGRNHHAARRSHPARTERRVAAPAPLHDARNHGRSHRRAADSPHPHRSLTPVRSHGEHPTIPHHLDGRDRRPCGGSKPMEDVVEVRGRDWFVGVDWSSQPHHVFVIDAQGRKLGERGLTHGGEGLAEMAAWIEKKTGAAPNAMSVAIEVPHGPVSNDIRNPSGGDTRNPSTPCYCDAPA